MLIALLGVMLYAHCYACREAFAYSYTRNVAISS